MYFTITVAKVSFVIPRTTLRGLLYRGSHCKITALHFNSLSVDSSQTFLVILQIVTTGRKVRF